MKKLLAVITIAFLLALPVAYAEEQDNLELQESDLLIEGVDVESSDGLIDGSIPVDMEEFDLALGELEVTDSNEAVPSSIAAPNAYGDIAIDVDNFPDTNFRAYVSEKVDTDGDGYLSEEEIHSVTVLEIYDLKI